MPNGGYEPEDPFEQFLALRDGLWRRGSSVQMPWAGAESAGVRESAALVAAVIVAQQHADAGQPSAARAQLDWHFNDWDFTGITADPVVIDAVLLYARLIDGPRQLAAAEYVYRCTCGYPVQHFRRIEARRLLGMAARCNGDHRRAIAVQGEAFAGLQRAGLEALAAEAQVELADTLHRAGHCGEAARHAGLAWHTWYALPDRDHQQGLRIAGTYARLLASCRRRVDLQLLIGQTALVDGCWRAILQPTTRDFGSHGDATHTPMCAGRFTDIDDLIAACGAEATP
jgi:hypothetical protein